MNTNTVRLAKIDEKSYVQRRCVSFNDLSGKRSGVVAAVYLHDCSLGYRVSVRTNVQSLASLFKPLFFTDLALANNYFYAAVGMIAVTQEFDAHVEFNSSVTYPEK